MSGLGEKSIWRQYMHYAVPSVIGMVVTSFYTIVDGIFVGRGVGEAALGAINIVFPFIMVQIALSMLIAIGGANLFSENRGRGDDAAANEAFRFGMLLLVVLGIAINAAVMLFAPEVCRLLGADDTLLPMAVDYIWWIALFGIFQMPGMGLGVFVRNDNAPNREMAGTLAGTVSNIVLDYLFIMVFDWGVAGAAIATGIGQIISLAIFLTHFLRRDRALRFGPVKLRGATLRKMLSSGTPSFLMEFSQSAVAFGYNLVLMARVGDAGVSGYSIVMYICSIFNMVLIGLMHGAQPIMSFAYGGGDRLKIARIHKLAINTGLACTAVIYALVFAFGESLARIFVPGASDIPGMAADMMRYYFLAFFPIAITLIDILYLQVTERVASSTLVSFLRCVGFIQLFLLALPQFAGTVGIYLAFPLGEALNCLISRLLIKKAQSAEKGGLTRGMRPATEH